MKSDNEIDMNFSLSDEKDKKDGKVRLWNPNDSIFLQDIAFHNKNGMPLLQASNS